MSVPKQLPNIITVARILCAPVFLFLLLEDNGAGGPLRWWAAVLFIVAIASDGIDGYLARRYKLVSDFGKIMDPVADKVITGAAFIGLSILNELPWWVTIIVLIREIGITVYRFVVVNDHVLAAAWMGKLKTVAQAVALSLALMPLAAVWGDWVNYLNTVVMSIAVVLTVVSGLDIVLAEFRARAKAANKHPDARGES